eukprot:1137216-Pelagomonas_calceolata.AAC.1
MQESILCAPLCPPGKRHTRPSVTPQSDHHECARHPLCVQGCSRAFEAGQTRNVHHPPDSTVSVPPHTFKSAPHGFKTVSYEAPHVSDVPARGPLFTEWHALSPFPNSQTAIVAQYAY